MNTIAVFGVGLIGGSFALALRQAGFTGEILGVSSPGTLARALELGIIDRGVSRDDACQAADLIYLAQPISQIIETLHAIGSAVAPRTLITDAGSTKAAIVEAARASVTRGVFLGGHPLAGKEVRGANAAEANLFRGRPYVVTPVCSEDLQADPVRTFLDWIAKLGSHTVVLEAAEHDRLVAFTSHLPQLLSTALACTVAQAGPEAAMIAGPALHDSTRLALSPFDIWGDIIATNANAIDQALAIYIAEIEQVRRDLTSPDMRARFDAGANFVRELRSRQNTYRSK